MRSGTKFFIARVMRRVYFGCQHDPSADGEEGFMRQVLIGVAWVASCALTDVAAQDCNGNGIPDDRDLVATFQGLGDLPGGYSSKAFGVSGNGSFVVGTIYSTHGQEAFRWTRTGGPVGLGALPGSFNGSSASSVSGDGSVVAGTSGGQTFRWTTEAGMTGLESAFGYPATPPAVSADGTVIVGGGCFCYISCYCVAVRWNATEGMVDLGHLPGQGLEARAVGVSADGSVVVGYSEWAEAGVGICDCPAGIGGCGFTAPFRWTAGTGMTTHDRFASTCIAGATDVSADGTAVVGWVDGNGFHWQTGDDTFSRWNAYSSAALAVSGDGSVAVGSMGPQAAIWDARAGARPLRAVLIDQYGLDLTGWTLTKAQDISSDGKTIVGWGTNPAGVTAAWIATLPSADSDGDAVLDVCDACGQSITGTTLQLGGCETGIANASDPDGCTLADRLSATCPAPVDKIAHGAFVSCVSHLVSDWRQHGRISAADGDRLVRCAARP
jgi:uncharacterized membrane protein